MTALKTKPEAQAELLPSLTQKSERNMGVELFRIVSMLLVILLHVMGHGGVYTYADPLSTNYTVAWFLETVGYCSVNCYAIISGFAKRQNQIQISPLYPPLAGDRGADSCHDRHRALVHSLP